MGRIARHWYFNKRPKDVIEADTLVLREDPVPALEPGQILIRSLYMSLDVTNRVWPSDWDTYMDPLPLGARMLGFIFWRSGGIAKSRFPEGFAGDRHWNLVGLDRDRRRGLGALSPA
ncbi:hypothetical protein [Parvibaculum sp.]|uniref:hypothetical protein n=1 Tax=Parvibaculum sp. TaxID=2024848 RepID=UPI00391C1596